MYAILLLAALTPGVKMDGVWLDAEAAKAKNLVRHTAKRSGATGEWGEEAGVKKFKVGRPAALAAKEAADAYNREAADETVYVDEKSTLDELNDRVLKPGTKVLFKRGGIWRGQLQARSGKPGHPIYYGAYGEGPKPVIEPSYDRSRPSDWKKVKNKSEKGKSADDIWMTETGAVADIGNIVFDHGVKGCAFKKQHFEDLMNDLDFRCDPQTFAVVIKSEKNPAERFASIELCEKLNCVEEARMHDVVYDGLSFRYTAAHGIGGDRVKRITVRNCDISWIGGGYLYYDNAGRGVRYGNGVEFWADCEDVLVESNRVWEVYDAGLTNQSNVDGAVQKNVTYRGNEVRNCEYSYEYWQQGDAARTENVLLRDNVFTDAGGGWGHRQRWNPNAAHLMFYDVTAKTENFIIENNVFSRSEDTLFRLFNDWWKDLTLRGNRWITGKGSLCRYHGRPTENLVYRYPDRLDQIHDDNLSEIESQTATTPRVFTASDLESFKEFFHDRAKK